MNAKRLLMPVVVSLAVVAGCDNEEKKPAAPAPTNVPAQPPAADKAAAEKLAAEKLAAEKLVADKAAAEKLAAEKAAAEKASAEKLAADKLAAEKAAAEKLAADKAAEATSAADAVKTQGTKLLGDLNTAITGGKWTDAEALIKQLDGLRDKLPADMQTRFDSLKKLYTDSKAKVPAIPGLGK